ncbi:hypothetical protein ACHBTE_15325 [Streptomyces sp. M41]|uniref:hypothetical protein n=1 Tax=Streptomyces sp. M41 TaxID=3059412 RepID=UPI00374CB06B
MPVDVPPKMVLGEAVSHIEVSPPGWDSGPRDCVLVSFRTSLDAVPHIRHTLRTVLKEWNACTPLSDTTELLVCELVTDPPPLASSAENSTEELWITVAVVQTPRSLTLLMEGVGSATADEMQESTVHVCVDPASNHSVMLVDAATYLWGSHRSLRDWAPWSTDRP